MVKTTAQITFILNSEVVHCEVSPGMLALDYVRERKRLTGTKQGCKEGDCGACTVILGTLHSDGYVEYKPMTSCLIPMGELEGKHLVTIEGLNMKELSPVQAAMVNCGGTQCGYCTPGFVVAMTAGLMEPKLPLNKEGFLYAISGNLCRCTGYRSIKEAGAEAMQSLAGKLGSGNRVADLCAAKALPEYFLKIPEQLRALQKPESSEDLVSDAEAPLVIAGGTDLYVQQGEFIPEKRVRLLNTEKPVGPARECGGRLYLDARMTFEAFADDPLIRKYIPDVAAYNLLIASWPMRTRSSIGGNICNASPIADMTCLFLALEAELTLTDGKKSRKVPLKDFYLGYKKLAKEAHEVVAEIDFPVPTEDCHINWEKVSKRAWLDIATVNSAAKIELSDGVITQAHLALGGVAATPLYLKEASGFFVGKVLSEKIVSEGVAIAMNECSPISDVRGSATYKKLLSRQLLTAHFVELFSDKLKEEAIYAAL